MGYDNWYRRCYVLVEATQDADLNKCNGCKQNSNDHLPPIKIQSRKYVRQFK